MGKIENNFVIYKDILDDKSISQEWRQEILNRYKENIGEYRLLEIEQNQLNAKLVKERADQLAAQSAPVQVVEEPKPKSNKVEEFTIIPEEIKVEPIKLMQFKNPLKPSQTNSPTLSREKYMRIGNKIWNGLANLSPL